LTSLSTGNTWTSTDAYGNTETYTQTITIEDTLAPVFVNTPAATETLECGCEAPGDRILVAVDQCDPDAPIEVTSEPTEATYASGALVAEYTYSWTATDSEGNSVSTSQIVQVKDTTAPVIVNTPASTTAECNLVPSAGANWARDECANDGERAPTLDFAETRVNGASAFEYTLNRKWTAEDAAGLTAEHTQTVTVQDTESPEFLQDDGQACLWPANGNVALFPNARASLFEVVDNCNAEADLIVTIISCNSSQPVAPGEQVDCAYDHVTDTLAVRAERLDHVNSGRTYSVWAIVKDGAGNQSNRFKKTIHVPFSQEQVDNGKMACQAGTVLDHSSLGTQQAA